MAATYQACSAALAKLGEPEAAWIAADRAMAAAERAGNPLLVAAGAFRLVFVFISARHYDQAEETARTAADALWRLADQGDPQAMSLWGGLTLQRAIIAARRNDADTAYGQLERAGRSPGGWARAATTTTPSSARPTSACTRSRSPSISAMRAGLCASPPRLTSPGCPLSGAPGCSSTWPALTPSAARSLRRSPRCVRPRRSPRNRSAATTWCGSSSLTCSPCKTRPPASCATSRDGLPPKPRLILVYLARTSGYVLCRGALSPPLIEGWPWKCRAGESPGARSRCHQPHMTAPERQPPWPDPCGRAPLTPAPGYPQRLAAVRLRSSTPARKGRREEHHLCPPTPPRQEPSGTPADACNPSCCAAALTTSTAPPANCSTATPPSTNRAASCPSRARPAAPPGARPAPRSTGPTPISSSAPG